MSSRRPFLFSQAFDFAAVGGASLALPLFLAFVFRGGTYHGGDWLFGPSRILWFTLVLPHYTSSYQLLYWDYARDITRRAGHFAAAVGVPAACAALLALIYLGRPLVPLAWMIQALFFLSGWHYAGQAYGCGAVLAAAKGAPLTREESAAARAHLLSLAVLSFVAPNRHELMFPYGGRLYASLGLPEWTVVLSALAWAVSGGALGALLLRRRARLPWLSVAALLSFYCWALPLVFFPNIFHAFRDVPFVAALHSLQYLVFVASLRLSKTPAPSGFSVEDVLPRAKEAALFVGAAALGQAAFVLLPRWADAHLIYDRIALGAGFFAAAAAVFVNIHHYCIDAVVWRKNPDVRALARAKAV